MTTNSIPNFPNEFEVPLWNDDPGEVSGSTPFGLYDDDPDFQFDAPRFAKWAARRLGFPVVNIELQSGSFYACFEEAMNEYGAQVNQYNIRENILSAQGSPTASDLTQKNIKNTLGRLIQLSKAYGTEAGSGGEVSYHSESIQVKQGVQTYDLKELLSDAYEGGKPIEIKRVFHFDDPASVRFYDPFVETGLGRLNILEDFGWSGLTTAIQYILFPVYEDLLRIQAVEFNDKVRKSAYSFELRNNVLKLFPIPIKDVQLWIEYILIEDRNLGDNTLESGVQSDYSNISYSKIPYQNVNEVGKQWIRRYGLACVKEVLGMIRSKYASIPIPNGDVTLDGDTLRSEATTEKEALIEELRENLDEASRRSQLQRKQEEDEAMETSLAKIPLKIYVA